MSTAIISGASSDELTVDPTSKAARVVLYGPDGKLVNKRPTFEGSIRVPCARLTAAVAAASLIWAMRYNGANILRVKSGSLQASFDGTAAATTSEYQIVRISAANPTGGTAIQPVATDTTYAIPSIDARFNYAAALTVAGVTIATEFAAEWGTQRQVSATNMLLIANRQALYSSFLDLRAGEGIAIRLGVVAVVGDALGGYFELQEYATTD